MEPTRSRQVLGRRRHTLRAVRLWPGVISWFLVGLPVLTAVVVTMRIKPYFGNMDDGRYVPLAGSNNPFSFAFILFDPENGFIRWSSWLVIWPASWVGDQFGAGPYFVTNIFLSAGVIAIFGYAYARFCHWPRQWSFPLFMGVSIAWPFTAELFFFPSLQEKAVILGAAMLLLWIKALDQVRTLWLQVLTLIPTTVLAFTTKTQILVFVPGLLASLWIARTSSNQQSDLWVRIIATILWTAASCGLAAAALAGTYARSTQGEVGASALQDRRFQLLVVVLLLYLAALTFRASRKLLIASDLVPAVLLLSICAAFFVWDFRNYYLAVASVSVATAVTTALSWIKSQWFLALAAVLATLLATAWLVFRLPQVYSSLASVSQFLGSAAGNTLNKEGATLVVSCVEAPVHYNEYAERFGLSEIDFVSAEVHNESGIDSDVYVFADSRLCPWPPSISTDAWKPIWASRFGSEAYRVFGR